MPKLTVDDVLAAGLTDWRQLVHSLHARFKTGDFTTGLAFVTEVAQAAERAGHHPDVRLTYPAVDVTLSSHDVGAVTDRDVDLARRISALARERGITAQPDAPTVIELALDTADKPAVGPFWAAVLTGRPNAYADGGEVIDPTGQVPLLWLQDTTAHDEPRQRFHLDVWVPHDVAEARIAAAVAAGGRVVDDSYAPSFVVLADPEGNKACICTFLERRE